MLLASLWSIIPELIILFSIFFATLVGAYSRKSFYQARMITALLLVAMIVALCRTYFSSMSGSVENAFSGNILINDFSRFMRVLVLFSAIFVLIMMMISHKNDSKEFHFESPILISLSVLGMLLLLSSNNYLILYLSLELMSLPLYIMAAINRNSAKSSEAGIKYFVLGALASGLILFGISLCYGVTSNLEFAAPIYAMNLQDAGHTITTPMLLLFGKVFILVAIFFKVSAAPFHMWAPDVYEGSPTTTTAFLATASKIAAFGILIKLLLVWNITDSNIALSSKDLKYSYDSMYDDLYGSTDYNDVGSGSSSGSSCPGKKDRVLSFETASYAPNREYPLQLTHAVGFADSAHFVSVGNIVAQIDAISDNDMRSSSISHDGDNQADNLELSSALELSNANIWGKIIYILAFVSLITGSVGALWQSNLKRLLAYSSIAHVGFLFMAVYKISDPVYMKAFSQYLVIYLIMTIAAFMILQYLKLSRVYNGSISSIAGLATAQPYIAFSLAVIMFSMAGVPPLAGFFAKLYIIMPLVADADYPLAIMAIMASVISAFYYLKVVKVMYFDANDSVYEIKPRRIYLSLISLFVLYNLIYVLAPQHLILSLN